MAVLFIISVLTFPLLAILGLAVLTAGESRVLNTVDYAKVPDRRALHRWVGVRLLLLAAGIAMAGVASVLVPAYVVPLGIALALGLSVGLGFIIAGTSRFQRTR